jgi:hypothetical protein
MKRVAKKNARRGKRRPKAKTANGKVSDLKTLDELATEQGIIGPQRWEDLYGAGKHLWDSEEEFDEFLKGIYERRQRGR